MCVVCVCVCEWEKEREVNVLWLACLEPDVYWNFPCSCARIQGQRAKFRGSMLGIHLQDGCPDSVLWGWFDAAFTDYSSDIQRWWQPMIELRTSCWPLLAPDRVSLLGVSALRALTHLPPVQKSAGPPFAALIRSVSVLWLRSLSNEPQLIGQMRSPWQSSRHGYQVTRAWYLINRWEWNTGWSSDMSDT